MPFYNCYIRLSAYALCLYNHFTFLHIYILFFFCLIILLSILSHISCHFCCIANLLLYKKIIALITRVASPSFRLASFGCFNCNSVSVLIFVFGKLWCNKAAMSHNELHCRTTLSHLFCLDLLFVAPFMLDLSCSHLLVSLFCAYKILYPYTKQQCSWIGGVEGRAEAGV